MVVDDAPQCNRRPCGLASKRRRPLTEKLGDRKTIARTTTAMLAAAGMGEHRLLPGYPNLPMLPVGGTFGVPAGQTDLVRNGKLP